MSTKGLTPWNKGQTASESMRKKLSEAQKRYWKQRESRKRSPLPEATRKKISLSLKGRPSPRDAEKLVDTEFETAGYRRVKDGWPDRVYIKDGQRRYVEIKRHPDEPLRPAQLRNHMLLADAGIAVEIHWPGKEIAEVVAFKPKFLPSLNVADHAILNRGRTVSGTYLFEHNGRDALVDAYQEALDLVMYLRQAIEERDARAASAASAASG